MQRLPAITHDRFSLFRFRSPLLTESRLLSLPVGTEMFHFPTFPPHALCVQARVTGHDSSGVSPFGNPRITVSVINSPRLIADSYVLLRLLVPRHPPCALKNLTQIQRCSRPLCSSQGTGGPDHLSPAPAAASAPRARLGMVDRSGGSPEVSVRRPGREGRAAEVRGFRPFPQDPTACPADPQPQQPPFPPEPRRVAAY